MPSARHQEMGHALTCAPMASVEWSGERVARWLEQAGSLDRQMAPITELLFSGAALESGERVLDVGCGSGPTTRQAAASVGPSGWVGGVDVSPEMLAAAATVPVTGDAAPIEWIEADVVAWQPEIDPVDVVLSRFGVMFFSEPRTAFANLARCTSAGGRMCVMAWDRRDRSTIFQIPLAATLAALRDAGAPAEEPPLDEGAFSLHDADHVTSLLDAAGWADVRHEQHVVPLRLGGGLGPEAAAEAAIGIGPSRVVTTGIDDERRRAVLTAITTALADHVDDRGDVVLPGSVIRITANRP